MHVGLFVSNDIYEVQRSTIFAQAWRPPHSEVEAPMRDTPTLGNYQTWVSSSLLLFHVAAAPICMWRVASKKRYLQPSSFRIFPCQPATKTPFV